MTFRSDASTVSIDFIKCFHFRLKTRFFFRFFPIVFQCWHRRWVASVLSIKKPHDIKWNKECSSKRNPNLKLELWNFHWFDHKTEIFRLKSISVHVAWNLKSYTIHSITVNWFVVWWSNNYDFTTISSASKRTQTNRYNWNLCWKFTTARLSHTHTQNQINIKSICIKITIQHHFFYDWMLFSIVCPFLDLYIESVEIRLHQTTPGQFFLLLNLLK